MINQPIETKNVTWDDICEDTIYSNSIPRELTDNDVQELTNLLYSHYNLSEYQIDNLYDSITRTWIVTRGAYTGTFLKRLVKALNREYKLKLEPNHIGSIGGMLGNASKAQNYVWDITSKFNWERGDFGDDGSCFWESRKAALPLMQNADNFWAIRFYDTENYTDYNSLDGIARAWLHVTDNGELVLFNGYGYQLVTIARFLATILGKNYSKITLTNNGVRDGLLWINGGSGYVIYDYDTEPISQYDFNLQTYYTTCECCGREIENDDNEYNFNGESLCEYCYNNHVVTCYHCNNQFWDGDESMLYYEGESYCETCTSELFITCAVCQNITISEESIKVDNGTWICQSCAALTKCTLCDHTGYNYTFLFTRDCRPICEDCANKLAQCENCHMYSIEPLAMVDFGDVVHYVCTHCLGYALKCPVCDNYYSRSVRYICRDDSRYYANDIYICQNCSDMLQETLK